MVLQPVKCPVCNGIDVTKHGNTSNGKQRLFAKNRSVEGKTFIQDDLRKGGYRKRNNKSLGWH